MGSRILLLLGLALALVVFISSEVAARDLVETSTKMITKQKATEMNGVDDAKYPSVPPIDFSPFSKVPRSAGFPPLPRVPSSVPLFGCPKGCCAQVYLVCLDCC